MSKKAHSFSDTPRLAIVTGGTKGIGLAISKAISADYNELILTYANDDEEAIRAVSIIEDLSPSTKVAILKFDITSPSSSILLVDYLSKRKLTPSLVVFNAGVTNRKSPFEITDEEWQCVIEGNVNFPVKVMKRLAPLMPRDSLFLCIGSMMAILPHSVSLAYGVTKEAVHSLVRNMVKHLEPYGIRIAGIAPGFIDTEWQKNKPLEIRASIESKVASHRFALPEEVAQVAKMIIENSYFNGDIVPLSGGYGYR